VRFETDGAPRPREGAREDSERAQRGKRDEARFGQAGAVLDLVSRADVNHEVRPG
jgi:hypothetical protein